MAGRAHRRRRLHRAAILGLGFLLVASALPIARSWSSLEIGFLYEDWSAEDFGDHGRLHRRKLRSWFPGPDSIQVQISAQRFGELRSRALGFEIRCGTIRPSSSNADTVGDAPFDFGGDSSDFEIYLSERLLEELDTEFAPAEPSSP